KLYVIIFFFFSSRRRHTRFSRDWSSDVCSSDLLRREGVYATDFPHKASGGNNSYISVEFQHPTINSATVKFNPKKITTPTTEGEYNEFKALSKYPNYLRYTDLNEFICNKRKAERYKYIAKFFGLEKFSLLQDTLQASINKQVTSLMNLHNTFDANMYYIY